MNIAASPHRRHRTDTKKLLYSKQACRLGDRIRFTIVYIFQRKLYQLNQIDPMQSVNINFPQMPNICENLDNF